MRLLCIVTLATAVALRWPQGVHCPTCGRTDVRFIATRRLWECKEKHSKRQFSVKVGTIFEDSALPLDKWFVAVWVIANCRNGISSHEVGRALGVTQKTAWFMLHRIRLAMECKSFDKFDGPAEADTSYIGGLAENMHAKRREKVIKGRGAVGKTAVHGVVQRSIGDDPSQVRASVIGSETAQSLLREVRSTAVRSPIPRRWNRPASLNRASVTLLRYRPVAANHAPPGLVTKTIGAMHGCGRLTVASMVALPPPADAGPRVAGKASVSTLANVPSLLTQLTSARKAGTVFEPV
jgi:transposase-like protein